MEFKEQVRDIWDAFLAYNMSCVLSATRFFRTLSIKPECVALGLFVFLILAYFNTMKLSCYKLMVKARSKFTPDASEFIMSSSSKNDKVTWELRKQNVGVYAIQGRRQKMEDRFNVVIDFENTGTSIYGIFDGHGGEFAADFVEKSLFKTIMVRLLKNSLDNKKDNYSQLLTEEILSVDKQLLEVAKATNDIAGTTALVALLQNNILTVANVGDSRGVICDKNGKTMPLSFDHKPQQLKEHKRIKKAGGFISFNGVWRVAGVLATSRALGDYPLKDHNFLIAEPDILTFNLKDIEPEFMILASDGLWDTFSNEEAVMYIRERLDEPHYGAKSIVLQAYYRGSVDNITVMIVNFKTKKAVSITKNGIK